MNQKKTRGYTQYFLKGFKFNALNVSFSLVLSLFSALIIYNKLEDSQFIFYSVSQITIYFFVSLSNLEFGKLVSKYFPNLNKDICNTVLKKLILTSLFVLLIGFIIFYVVSEYFGIYSYFENYKNLFYIYVFFSSVIQIISNYFGQYLAAYQKFDEQEKQYSLFSIPLKALGLLFFYFLFGNIYFILFVNFLVRIVNLAITFKISDFNLGNKLYTKDNVKELEMFSTKSNIKFTLKNFIFFNYPLFFFSYLPIYLANFHNENDIAVLSLSISLFNAIKPILNGIHKIINPSIQQLKKGGDFKKLFSIVNLLHNAVSVITALVIISLWSILNYSIFTDIIFIKFSFNLFSDLAITAVILSLFFILNMIYHSYFLSINLENSIFKSSILGVLASISLWLNYENLGMKINLSLIIILTFYLTTLIYFYLVSRELLGKNILYSLLTFIIYLFALNTLFYNSLIIFLLLNGATLFISYIFLQSNIKKYTSDSI